MGRMMKRCINNIDNSFKLVAVQGGGGGGGGPEADDEQSLLSLASSPPWLTIPVIQEEPEPESKELSACFFNPTNDQVYSEMMMKKRWLPDTKEALCVGSSHGWLAFIDSKCIIYLINPFQNHPDIDSDYRRIQLPSIETLPCILGVEREHEESGIVDFKYWNYYNSRTYTAPSNNTFKFFISKLVLSSAPDDDEYTAMAIYGELNDLAFCKSGDTSWTPLNEPKLLDDDDGHPLAFYEDIYYSATDQCFYAYRINGSFEIWDLRLNNSPPKCTHIHVPPPLVPPSLTSHEKWLRSWCSPKMYLVNFLGDLLMAVKHLAEQVTGDGQIHTTCDDDVYDGDDIPSHPYKTLAFDVYKFDWVQRQWVHVTCLGDDGDGVLFLGINNAMTFTASSHFPALRGNSIYFTDDNYDTVLNEDLSHGGHDLGIFSLEDGSMHPCFYPAGDFKKISPPPVWISPPNGLMA